MNSKAGKTFVLVAALAVSIAVAGTGRARTLDRRGAVREALAQNPQIASARAEEAALVAQKRQVSAAHWPMVSFTAGVGPALTAQLVPGTAVQSTQTQYSDFRFSQLSAVFLGDLTVIQPLYTFGKIALRGEAAERGRLAREAQTRMRRADVALEVARIYEGYLLARDFERFFDETIHWLESTLETTQDKLAKKVANTSERDILRTQAAIALATMGVNLARAGMAQARAGLVAYLGLPAGEQIEVAETELVPVGRLPGDFDSLLALAKDNRPELIAFRQASSALDALARAEAAGFKPDVFALGFVSAAYTPGRDWIETRYVVDRLNHVIPGLMLGLRWQFQGGHGAGARAGTVRARRRVSTPRGVGRRRHPGGGPQRVRRRRARGEERRHRQRRREEGQAVDGAGVRRSQHRVRRHPRGVGRDRGLRRAAQRGVEGALRSQRRDGRAVEGDGDARR